MIRCPSCGKQSYASAGRLVAVKRLLAAPLGNDRAWVRCLDCGHRWKSAAVWVVMIRDAVNDESTAIPPVWRKA